VWLGLGGQTSSQLVAANTVVLLTTLNAAALALRPFTVMRTRARILWRSDQVAADEQPFGAYGRMVVSDQASAVGVTAVPDPVVNGDAPWYVWESVLADLTLASAIGFTTQVKIYEIDSKAMRKVGNNEDLVSVITNTSSAHGAEVIVIGRTLIKVS